VSVTCLRCAKTAKRIEVLLGVDTIGNPGSIVLDRGTDPLMVKERTFDTAFGKLLYQLVVRGSS